MHKKQQTQCATALLNQQSNHSSQTEQYDFRWTFFKLNMQYCSEGPPSWLSGILANSVTNNAED